MAEAYDNYKVAQRDFEATLKPRDLETIRAYAGSPSSWDFNKILRTGNILNIFNVANKLHDIERLTKLLKKASFPDNAVVYRGLKNLSADDMAKFTPGAEFQDKGFVSNTVDKGYASYWAGRTFGNGVAPGSVSAIIKYVVPKGAPAIFVEQNMTRTGQLEGEVVLQRGSKFRVKSVTDYAPPASAVHSGGSPSQAGPKPSKLIELEYLGSEPTEVNVDYSTAMAKAVANFDPNKHPRKTRGPGGGEFAPKGGATASAQMPTPAPAPAPSESLSSLLAHTTPRQVKALAGGINTGTFLDDVGGIPVVEKAWNQWESPNEVAAYELDKLLGLGVVPETVKQGEKSFQAHVDGLLGDEIPNQDAVFKANPKDVMAIAILDTVGAQVDRRGANWFYDKAKNKFWAIDNGRMAWADVGLVKPVLQSPFVQAMLGQPVPPDILKTMRAITEDQFKTAARNGVKYTRREWTREDTHIRTEWGYDQAWARFQRIAATGKLTI